MDTKQYMIDRVNQEIEYYTKKSHQANLCYKFIQTIEIIVAALIPVLSGYTSANYISFTIGLLGSLLAILGSIQKLHKFQENWIGYHNTKEQLKTEKYLYLTYSGPYQKGVATPSGDFIKNIEGIISSENNSWKSIHSKSFDNTITSQEQEIHHESV